jgi:alkylhydroperoxidase family enzyme
MIKAFPETETLGIRAVAQRRPQVWLKFLELANEIMHVESELSQLDRELLGAYVSMKFGCDFCHLGHLDTAEALGGAAAKALVSAPNPAIQPLFDLVDKVISNEMTDVEVQKLRDAGYGDKALEDVIFVAALFGFANRMVTGFGINYVQNRDQASSKMLAKGYIMPR